mmetsp:Transcript_29135/g.33086  ORF Transcript_29135/g.33086 Transcript_29135/m.33086 type:complete len:383 (-) Transcript_29135:216-1364(-)
MVVEMIGGAACAFSNRKKSVRRGPGRGIRLDAGFWSMSIVIIVIIIIISVVIGIIILGGRPQTIFEILGKAFLSSSRKNPTLDGTILGIPFQDINATPLFVHPSSDRIPVGTDSDTALIFPLVRCLCPAIVGLELRIIIQSPGKSVGDARSGIPGPRPVPAWHVRIHVTLLRGVQGRFCPPLLVDGFDDVDFASLRPMMGVGRPKGGPDTTPRRHTLYIQHNQTMVDMAFTLKADRLAKAMSQQVVVGSGSRRQHHILIDICTLILILMLIVLPIVNSLPLIVTNIVISVTIAIICFDLNEIQGFGSVPSHVRVVSRRPERIGSINEVVIIEKRFPLVGFDQCILSRSFFLFCFIFCVVIAIAIAIIIFFLILLDHCFICNI